MVNHDSHTGHERSIKVLMMGPCGEFWRAGGSCWFSLCPNLYFILKDSTGSSCLIGWSALSVMFSDSCSEVKISVLMIYRLNVNVFVCSLTHE